MNEIEDLMKLNPTAAPLVRQIIRDGHVPDILTCIANLSSDEVFTPPELVDKILDLFPEEVWHDSSLKWLDPACKTGIFLRQIASRLMEGLRGEFPDEEERRQHIFQNMLYGIAITDLTAMMSRRSLYTSKKPNGEKSIAHFDTETGNIFYENRPHTYEKGVCIYCGNKEGGELDRDKTQERHAYNFIHLTPKEAKTMKFDIIVGNPPYQLSDGGNGASAAPIYHYFVEQAIKLKPQYISFIIPSRWFAGGKGLDSFRNMMLHNRHIKELYDYPNAEDCFPGVEIAGGVCYFIMDLNYEGKCKITTILQDEYSSMDRYLDETDIFVRWNKGIPILRKVKNRNETTISEIASARKPFGLATNFKDFDNHNNPDKYKIYSSSQTGNREIGYVEKTLISKGHEYINKWKVLMPKAYRLGSATDGGTIHPIIAEPGSVCTETFIVLKSFNTEKEANNFAKYIKTRFFRFLVLLHKLTQDATAKVYSFVPDLNMSQEWTDEKLYDRYDITPAEQRFIESLIKEI